MKKKEKIIVNAQEEVVETTKEETAFEKGKRLGAKYKKKILYGCGTIAATGAGFLGGMLFEKRRNSEAMDEEDYNLIDEEVDL